MVDAFDPSQAVPRGRHRQGPAAAAYRVPGVLGTTTTLDPVPPTTASLPIVTVPTIHTAPCRSIEELDEVFGTRGAAAHCWCQFDRLTNEERRDLPDDELRDRLATQVRASGPSPGVVASIGGERVGWCSVGPRVLFPRLARSPATSSPELGPPDDPAVWSATCFVVRTGFRRRGVATALLAAAVEHARAGGAGWLEGYPVDTAERPTATAAELYRGSLSLFLAAGFEVVARTLLGRAVVRREL